jgi:hypothetical protein
MVIVKDELEREKDAHFLLEILANLVIDLQLFFDFLQLVVV